MRSVRAGARLSFQSPDLDQSYGYDSGRWKGSSPGARATSLQSMGTETRTGTQPSPAGPHRPTPSALRPPCPITKRQRSAEKLSVTVTL